MANIKSQIKRVKTNEKSRLMNNSFKSAMKTAIKAVETSVAHSNKEEAVKALHNAFAKLDKALAKGIVHKNFVSRNKSRLSILVNSLN